MTTTRRTDPDPRPDRGRSSRRFGTVVVLLVAAALLLTPVAADAQGLEPSTTSTSRPAATDGPAGADGDATSAGAPDPTAAGSARGVASTHGSPAVEPITVGTLNLFDSGRATPARGSVPGHAGRSLPTTVVYPTSPGPWPLVVFAHGYNVTPATYNALLGSIAAAGYVVAAPYFPGERSDVPGTPMQSDIPNEPGDLSFVITSVTNANADPSSFLHGRVDTSRIGAAGHSDGGIAVAALALNSATVDYRVRATAVMSGGFWPIPGGSWGAVQAGSVLVSHGTADPIASYSTDHQLYDMAARAPKAFLNILGGGHLPPYVGSGAQPDLVRASINDYLDSALAGDPSGTSRLFVDGNQSGLTGLQTDGIQPNPFGFYDAAVAAGNQAVHVTGWSIDPDSDDPIPVHVWVDGRFTATVTANGSRPDVAAAYPAFSTQHGIDAYVRIPLGTHDVCLVPQNVGFGDDNGNLGCRSVTIFPQVFAGQSVSNADGRLEVFSVKADHSLEHIWQATPGGAWSPWFGLGGVSLAGNVQLATNGDGRLEIFGIGTDGQLWHRWQLCAGCDWSGWDSLGGSWQPDKFSVAANWDGRLEIFAIGSDGTVQHTWQPAPFAGWSGFISLEPSWATSPSADVAGIAAARQPDGRLAVAATDPAGNLMLDVQISAGSPWLPWATLKSGGTAGAPIFGVNEDRRLELFAVASNGQAWHAFENGANAWSTASALGGAFDPATNLAVGNNVDQRLDLFGSAPGAHAITHAIQGQRNGPFGGFVGLGSNGTSLSTASNPDGRQELFSMTLPVRHAWQVTPNGGWVGMIPLN